MDTKNINDKSTIKTDRIKSFFIDAAREIVLEDGAESVTVRKIAELSGYSYGTIYHYFKDLDALMFEVKNVMILDIVKVMNREEVPQNLTIDEIKQSNHMFMDYFIDNPNIYGFLYKYQLKNSNVPGFSDMDIGEAYWDTYKGFVDAGIITREQVPVVAKTLIYAMYGLLALYFSSNGLTKEKLHQDMDEMTDFILKG